MYTRCPNCQTHFRVSREQLQASSGQVRCGRCQSVFDAFATLSAQPPAASRARATPAPSPGREASVATVSAPEIQTAPAQETAEAAQSIEAIEAAPAPRDADEPGTEPTVEPLTLPDDLFGSGVPAPATGRRWPWAVGCAALALALLLQFLFFLGSDVAAAVPGMRPIIAQSCDWLGCKVALARVPDQLFIDASDMQVLNPANPNEVLLTATIRNRAAVTQELPLLEVTLTDAANQTAARKVFYPADYLDKAGEQLTSVGPNQEILVKLYLDTSDIKPTGYRLYLFFG
jgi:predicted Zn finger-like uncharacterized protein